MEVYCKGRGEFHAAICYIGTKKTLTGAVNDEENHHSIATDYKYAKHNPCPIALFQGEALATGDRVLVFDEKLNTKDWSAEKSPFIGHINSIKGSIVKIKTNKKVLQERSTAFVLSFPKNEKVKLGDIVIGVGVEAVPIRGKVTQVMQDGVQVYRLGIPYSHNWEKAFLKNGYFRKVEPGNWFGKIGLLRLENKNEMVLILAKKDERYLILEYRVRFELKAVHQSSIVPLEHEIVSFINW